MDIKEKIKKTMLLPKYIKKSLLSMDEIPTDINDLLDNLFKLYGDKEQELLSNLKVIIGKTYIKSIQEVEFNKNKENMDYLKSLEDELSKL